MVHLLIIGFGGFIGAVARYELSGWVYEKFGTRFPYGTFAVNILGCFLLGLFLTLSEERFLIRPEWRSFIAIGMLGAFTTFSTFGFETLMLMREGSYLSALWNVAASIGFGLLAAFAGVVIAKFV